ncbi:hypothetical protein [Bacteroides acidifaciens]|uniref:hypothetical protein n=1 Tax=Bacteroides acidifaciens TaxID=85831 RepID=UPI002558370B|nr:hypothetical protein [Bacteroides acidifaciens]
MKNNKKIKLENATPLTSAEMREESVDRIWPFDPDKCGITELCPDGRRISCQGPVGTCKRLYVSFGDSGTDSSGVSSSFLLGIACGDTIIHCSDGSSGTMPAKVSACLGKKEWDTCTFLSSNGSDKGGYCRYGDPAAPNEFKNYLYCSDLGQLPNP